MITPAFADPVRDSQQCFRAVLEAMSRPGRVQCLPAGLMPPLGLDPATAAVLLTLADAETSLHHDAGDAADAWLRFHCGSPAAAPDQASFVLATATAPALTALDAGSDEEPESGATLILQVASLAEGQGWLLSGPGIERQHRLAVGGMPAGFLAAWQAQRGLFPRGVDVLLCAGHDIAALPRTTLIEEG
jgi:alpha-D-ribose 1-methylphosphonate 5-triphosphate synthase subunit PhnH